MQLMSQESQENVECRMSIGPLVHRSIGPWDHGTIGPLIHWSIGLLVHWSIGPLVNWSIVPLVECQMSLLSERTSGAPPVIFAVLAVHHAKHHSTLLVSSACQPYCT